MGIAKSRINILDGFRAIAILLVIFFHYFSRWTPPINAVSLYPYNNQYNYFKLGYLGVQFFFIISGFVIFFTLERTSRFILFWKKRMIRLWPSIIIVTLLTYIIFNFFDPNFIFPGSHYSRNFLPSFTFITPDFFNTIFSKPHYFSYTNGVYWSLWPEVQFYVFASIIFYSNKEKFTRNFVVISIALILLNLLMLNIVGSNKLHIQLPPGFLSLYSVWINGIFNLLNYLPAFAIGVLFYLLFKNNKLQVKTSFFIKTSLTVLILCQLYSGDHSIIRLVYILMLALFFCFVYFPGKLAFLENRLFVKIGISSYFLYLVHEHIAVLIINSFGQYFYPVGFLLPLLLIFLMISLSILYTEKIDSRITVFFKR